MLYQTLPPLTKAIQQPHDVKQRVSSIDLLRGLVMIIMALDHCRDFFHYNANIDQDPLDLATTTPALFLTRWITHFCAPVFVLLTGTGTFLYAQRGKTKKEMAVFLFTRGLWLMAAEILLIGPLWNLNPAIIVLQVIWAIGLCMVLLAFLQLLPSSILLSLGVIIILGHNLLDSIQPEQPLWLSVLWSIVHVSQAYPINESQLFVVLYPFLPWLGIMLCGYALGKLYAPGMDASKRQKFLYYTGILLIALFLFLRWSDLYGDVNKWQSQTSFLFTVFDFIDVTKYPPSLLYTLITIGPALIFLAFAEHMHNKLVPIITVFGKVPFFYYVLHLALIHVLSYLLYFATGHSWSNLDFDHVRPGTLPFGSGYSLWVVYVAWMVVVVLLYFPCRWYSRYKATHQKWWLSYI